MIFVIKSLWTLEWELSCINEMQINFTKNYYGNKKIVDLDIDFFIED